MRLLALAFALVATAAEAGVFRYTFRVQDSSADPTRRVPQFIFCTTEAELPATGLADGDVAYAGDTARLFKRASGAWSEVGINVSGNFTWTGQHNFTSAEILGASPLRFEGATDNNTYTTLAVTDPTGARTFTIPNADSVAIQPLTCGGTDKVSAVSAAGVITCTADTGGAGSSNFAEVSVVVAGGFTTATITGQSWVTATSKITCSSFGTTADGNSPETAAVAHFGLAVSDRVAGTGFNLHIYSPNGAEGTFRFHCTGG